jgi:hypothetical protein
MGGDQDINHCGYSSAHKGRVKNVAFRVKIA